MTTEEHNPHNPDTWDPSFSAAFDQVSSSWANRQVCDWLRANGLDPAHLPADPHASLTDGQLTLLRKVRGPNGYDVVDPHGAGVVTETITVPVTVPPPPIVEIWLAPKCPTCGR